MKKILLFIFAILIFSAVSCTDAPDSADTESREVEIVQISHTGIVMYAGQTYKLEATVLPADADNAELSWSSSHPEVCVVENGFLTAVAKGITTITAKASNGKSASLKVEVRQLSEIKSISMTELDVSLQVGESRILETVVTPSSASAIFPLIWSSSDDSVAVVDENGVVTAVGEGTCIILASISDVSRAACMLTVTKNGYESDSPVPEEPSYDIDVTDLSLLVETVVEGLPMRFECKDSLDRVLSAFELSSYDVMRELTANGVTVTLLIYGVKTFDVQGDDALNAVAVDMELYMENGELGDRWLLKSEKLKVGDEVVFEFSFNAVIKPYQRIFCVVLKEEGSGAVE